MTDAEFSRQIAVYENSLAPETKKANGIFYTGLSLADKILEELDIQTDAIVLDPCCGTGSFNYAAIRRGICRTYGADIDQSAIAFCVATLPEGTFINADSLNKSGAYILSRLGLHGKVDYVVGNPPYARWTSCRVQDAFSAKVAGCGNNMFIAALLRAMEMVRDGGTVSYILPKNFLHVAVYRNLRKEILRTMTIVSITDIGAYFPHVRGEQIVFTFRNTRPEPDSRFLVKKLIDGRFMGRTDIAQTEFSDEIILLSNETDTHIYNRLRSYDTLGTIYSGFMGRGRQHSAGAVSGKDIRKFGFKQKPTPESGDRIFIQNIYSSESGIIATSGGTLDAGDTVTVIVEENERMRRFLLGLLHSKICNFFLFRYCYNNSRLTMHTDAKYLKKVPVPPVTDEQADLVVNYVNRLETETYLSDRWLEVLDDLDNAMYDAYRLSDDEKKFIDAEMRNIHSKKWTSRSRQ